MLGYAGRKRDWVLGAALEGGAVSCKASALGGADSEVALATLVLVWNQMKQKLQLAVLPRKLRFVRYTGECSRVSE